MKSTSPNAPTRQKKWLEQWKSAGVELALERKKVLQNMTDEQALAASEAVLALADPSKLSPHRRNTSGLVEQQALFHSRNRDRRVELGETPAFPIDRRSQLSGEQNG